MGDKMESLASEKMEMFIREPRLSGRKTLVVAIPHDIVDILKLKPNEKIRVYVGRV
jgi:hypothetical protein